MTYPSRESLRRVLARASELLTTGGVSHVTLRAADVLTVAASDSTASYAGSIETPGDTVGWSATVDLRLLFQAVRELPCDPEVYVGAGQLHIRAGGASFKLPIATDVDAPTVAAPDGLVTVDGAELARILATVAPSVAQEDVRWGLNGVHLESTDDGLTAVATDGHRLALASMATPARVTVPARSLLSRRAIKALAKLADSGPVRFGLVDGAVWLATDSEVLRFSLIEGEFPDYRAILPKEDRTVVECRTADLQAALRRVSLVVGRDNKPIRFALSREGVALSATQDGARAEDALSADVTGPTHDIGLRGPYLADVLAGCGDTVTMGMTNPLAPVSITSADRPGTRWIIMPMRLD